MDPKVWLASFLENACFFSRKDYPSLFKDENYSEYSVLLWQDLDQPPRLLEGKTQADVFILLKNATIMIECKGLAPLQKFVTTDNRKETPRFWWDQAIRNIVRGYVYSRKHFSDKDFFFVVLSMSEQEETFDQYQDWHRLKEQVEKRVVKDPRLRDFFPTDFIDNICQSLSRQIRWVKWSELKKPSKSLHSMRQETSGLKVDFAKMSQSIWN
jgi:hypothetical protein